MNGRCTVFVDEGAWRVACVEGDAVRIERIECAADADVITKAQAVAERLETMSVAGSVVVALPSEWCLSATFGAPGLGRSGRRKALGYLLEEQLPVSAEDSIADFVEHDGRVLGVCGELDRLRAIVDALEQHDLAVQHICPSAMLATGCLNKQHHGADGIVLKHGPNNEATDAGERADLITLWRGRPEQWWWLVGDGVPIADQLDGVIDGEPSDQAFVWIGHPSDLPGIRSISTDFESIEHAAALYAASVLAGDTTPWIDLRRDALVAPGGDRLYRKQAGALALALFVLFVSVCLGMAWRGQQYQRLADDYVDQQRDVFEQALPGQRVPVGIRRRLESEQQKLVGLGGQASPHADTGDEALHPTSALTHLHRVLSALPKDLRYQVSDLSIEPDLVRVDGSAESHLVAEQLAGAIRSAGGYDVTPPNTRALRGFGVSFGLFARPVADTATPAEPMP